MKFTIQAKAFSDALQAVARVVETRNTYPILANIFLSAKGGPGIGELTLRATDLDIEITLVIDVAVYEAGTTTIPARTLSDIVKKFAKEAEVTFEATDETATVKSGRSRFNLSALSPDSFPDLKAGEFAVHFEMPSKDLSAGFGKVAFAISTEETRYYLNGIYMHALKDKLRLVTTDGHRLARLEIALPEGANGMEGIIVPKKTVAELTRILDAGGDTPAVIEVSHTKIRVSVGRLALLSKLIEGTFPDYERVTPKTSNHVALANRKDFAKAVDRVSIISSARSSRAIKVAMADNLMTIEANNPDQGSASEEMAVSFDAANEFSIGFNSNYLGTILEVLGGDEIRMSLIDPGSPTVFTSESDPSLLTVLMPMRV